jgi:hypothetical protein
VSAIFGAARSGQGAARRPGQWECVLKKQEQLHLQNDVFLRIKILLFWEMMLGFGWKINKNIILAIADNLLQTVVVC